MVVLLLGGIFLAIFGAQGRWEVVYWGIYPLIIVCTILGSVLLYSAGTAVSTRIGTHICKVKIDKLAEEGAMDFATSFFEHKSRM